MNAREIAFHLKDLTCTQILAGIIVHLPEGFTCLECDLHLFFYELDLVSPDRGRFGGRLSLGGPHCEALERVIAFMRMGQALVSYWPPDHEKVEPRRSHFGCLREVLRRDGAYGPFHRRVFQAAADKLVADVQVRRRSR